MIDGIEILADIQFGKPMIPFAEVLGAFQRHICTLSNSTCIAIVNLVIIENRVTYPHHGMEYHSMLEGCGTDDSFLGVVDGKEMIIAKLICPIKQLVSDSFKILVKMVSELHDNMFV